MAIEGELVVRIATARRTRDARPRRAPSARAWRAGSSPGALASEARACSPARSSRSAAGRRRSPPRRPSRRRAARTQAAPSRRRATRASPPKRCTSMRGASSSTGRSSPGRAPEVEALAAGAQGARAAARGRGRARTCAPRRGNCSAWARQAIFGRTPAAFLGARLDGGLARVDARGAARRSRRSLSAILAERSGAGRRATWRSCRRGGDEWSRARARRGARRRRWLRRRPALAAARRARPGRSPARQSHPLVADAVAPLGTGRGRAAGGTPGGDGAGARGAGRAIRRTGHGAAPLDGASAIAWVETARGLLVHRVALDGERIAGYRIVAPTEWNFHPAGAFARGALGLAAADDGAARDAACAGWSPRSIRASACASRPAMHEMSIAESVLGIVEESARREGFAARERSAARDRAARGGGDRGASLLLRRRGARQRRRGRGPRDRRDAGQRVVLRLLGNGAGRGARRPCPRCGSAQLQVNGGTEMRVKDLFGV